MSYRPKYDILILKKIYKISGGTQLRTCVYRSYAPDVVLFTVYYINMNRSQEIDILCWYLLYLMFMGSFWWSLSYVYICRSNVGLILRKIYPTRISMTWGRGWGTCLGGGGVYPHY